MKKEFIYHTICSASAYITNRTNVKEYNTRISGYIYRISNRRLFGFIPLPDKLQTEVKIEYFDDWGDIRQDLKKDDFDSASQYRIENQINNLTETLKCKRKEFAKRKKM